VAVTAAVAVVVAATAAVAVAAATASRAGKLPLEERLRIKSAGVGKVSGVSASGADDEFSRKR
jgi:uncharacterized membrane protein